MIILFYSLIYVQLTKTTLILKRREYNITHVKRIKNNKFFIENTTIIYFCFILMVLLRTLSFIESIEYVCLHGKG